MLKRTHEIFLAPLMLNESLISIHSYRLEVQKVGKGYQCSNIFFVVDIKV